MVVRGDSKIKGLADLRGKRVYIGKDGSGTKQIAEAVLKGVGIVEGDYTRVGATDGFMAASRKLQIGDLDVAIFTAGIPTEAVKEALEEGGCRLVTVNISPQRIQASTPGFDQVFQQAKIPANSYEGQGKSIQTLGVQVILASRKDLDDDLVSLILGALFDHIKDLLLVHAAAQDIRFQEASVPKLPPGVRLHPGAARFWKHEKTKLLVATGSLTGIYYDKGKIIETLLRQNGIPARRFTPTVPLKMRACSRIANGLPLRSCSTIRPLLCTWGGLGPCSKRRSRSRTKTANQ